MRRSREIVVLTVVLCVLIWPAIPATATALDGESATASPTIDANESLSENESARALGSDDSRNATGHHGAAGSATQHRAVLDRHGALLNRPAQNESWDVPAASSLQNLTMLNESALKATSDTNAATAGGVQAAVVYNGSQSHRVNATTPKAAPTAAAGARSQRSVRGEHGRVTVADPGPVLSSTANTGIIDADDRRRVASENITSAPWAPVVELRIITQSGQRAGCSGIIITEEDAEEPSSHVLTAAHCVYWHGTNSFIDITPESEDGTPASRVVPAADGSTRPFGAVGITGIRTYSAWTDDQDARYDFALLTLEEPIGAETGSAGYRAVRPDSSVYTADSTRLVGYPGDKPLHTMWTDADRGLGTWLADGGVPQAHRYRMDNYAGMSGGPVWVSDHPAVAGRQVVAVNAYAVNSDRDGATDFNSGPRITRARFDDLQRWMAADDNVSTPENDQLEPNDGLAEATAISRNTTVSSLRIVQGENDVFAVEVPAGSTLTASAVFEHASGDLNLALYDSAGTVLDASTSKDDNETVTTGALANGTYYIQVYGVEQATANYTLAVASQPGTPSVNAARMCTTAPTDEPYTCPAGSVTSTFISSSPRAVSWVDFGSVYSTFNVTWRFYAPNGELYGTVNRTDAGGRYDAYRAWAWLEIAGTPAADRPGEWNVTVSVDGEKQRTQSFVIERTDAPNGSAPDVNGDGTPAQDLNWDGVYEDINGDGRLNVLDVAMFLDRYTAAPVQENPAAFDFNNDGRVNVIDVSVLFDSV